MSPRERLYDHAWPAFKRLAIRTLGRLGAAQLMRECADLLEAEEAVEEKRRASSNVISLEDRLATS